MKVSLNRKDGVNGIIAIEIEKNDYQEKVNQSINHFRQQANMPGFRKGKVPKALIQKMYGKSIVADEVNKLVSQELFKYINENDLHILGDPLPSETSDKTYDFEKDETFEFVFDIALSPEFELTLDKRTKLTYYIVKSDDELVEKQVKAHQSNFGEHKKVEEPTQESDLIKGKLIEWVDGKAKEEGLTVENAILMPSYIKDEETKKSFIGVKKSDRVVFNPHKAYDNNEAEIASLLQTTKENVNDTMSDFCFEIDEVTRFEEATLDTNFFDKVLGEGVAKTEEEFKEKVKEVLNEQFRPNSDYLFSLDAREMILEKMKEVKLPDTFLKRWLKVSDENKTDEDIENEYPKIVEDLKFHLAKSKFAKDNDIKIEPQDIDDMAKKVARAQFAQYGMHNLGDDMLQNYVQNMLQNEETVRNFHERVLENKFIDWVKESIKISEKEVSLKEFEKLIEEKQKEK